MSEAAASRYIDDLDDSKDIACAGITAAGTTVTHSGDKMRSAGTNFMQESDRMLTRTQMPEGNNLFGDMDQSVKMLE